MRFHYLLTSSLAAAIGINLAACGGSGSSSVPTGASVSLLPTTQTESTTVDSAIHKDYVLTDLGTGLPGSPGLVPAAINNQGTVVGEASVGALGSLPTCSPETCGPPEGWIFENGTLRQLPPLDSDSFTFADDINNEGVVSGGSAGNIIEEAVLWKPNGTIRNLGTGLADSDSSAEAFAISNSGKIVGVSYDATNTIPTTFNGSGGASLLCGNVQGYPSNINDAGFTAGLLYLPQGGTAAMTCPPFGVIEAPPNPTFADFAVDLNNRNQIVGRITIGPSFGNFHPFLYQDGHTTDLGTLFPDNPASVGAAFGINDPGVIAGWSAAGGGVPGVKPIDPSAIMVIRGKMVNLNTLLPEKYRSTWRLVVANAINNRGQIAGTAWVGGYPNGVEHAFLLSPRGCEPAVSTGVVATAQSISAKTLGHNWANAPIMALRAQHLRSSAR